MKINLLLSLLLLFSLNSLKAQSPMAPVKVIVVNFSNVPQANETILFVNKKSGKTIQGTSGPDGTFDTELPGGHTYEIKIKSIGKAQDYSEVKIPGLEPNQSYGTVKLTVQFELPKTFTLDNVLFETGSYKLTGFSFAELNELAEYLTLKKEIKIEIAGHTDNVGEDAANLKLSQDRANTVRNYLIKKGINPARVTAVGYGETQPIADNSTAQGRKLNRRTEVRIK